MKPLSNKQSSYGFSKKNHIEEYTLDWVIRENDFSWPREIVDPFFFKYPCTCLEVAKELENTVTSLLISMFRWES